MISLQHFKSGTVKLDAAQLTSIDSTNLHHCHWAESIVWAGWMLVFILYADSMQRSHFILQRQFVGSTLHALGCLCPFPTESPISPFSSAAGTSHFSPHCVGPLLLCFSSSHPHSHCQHLDHCCCQDLLHGSQCPDFIAEICMIVGAAAHILTVLVIRNLHQLPLPQCLLRILHCMAFAKTPKRLELAVN